MTPVAPIGGFVPTNGKLEIHEAPAAAIQPPSMEDVRKAAVQWAEASGLKQPFVVAGPVKESFPRHGHGFVVTIQEQSGRRTLGTARFTEDGKPSMWTVDGVMGV